MGMKISESQSTWTKSKICCLPSKVLFIVLSLYPALRLWFLILGSYLKIWNFLLCLISTRTALIWTILRQWQTELRRKGAFLGLGFSLWLNWRDICNDRVLDEASRENKPLGKIWANLNWLNYWEAHICYWENFLKSLDYLVLNCLLNAFIYIISCYIELKPS